MKKNVIEKIQIKDWFNVQTREMLFGLNVRVNGGWLIAVGENDKILFYHTYLEAKLKGKELMLNNKPNNNADRK